MTLYSRFDERFCHVEPPSRRIRNAGLRAPEAAKVLFPGLVDATRAWQGSRQKQRIHEQARVNIDCGNLKLKGHGSCKTTLNRTTEPILQGSDVKPTCPATYVYLNPTSM